MTKKRIWAWFLMLIILTSNTLSVSASAGGVGPVAETESMYEYINEEEETEESSSEISVEESSVEKASAEESVVEDSSMEEYSVEETSSESMETEETSFEETSVEETMPEASETEMEETSEITTEEETLTEETTETVFIEETEVEETTESASTQEELLEEVFASSETKDGNVLLSCAGEKDGIYEVINTYATLQDALTAIEELGKASNFYKIELRNATEDAASSKQSTIQFPSKAAGIIICAGEEVTEPVLYFKGNIKMACDVTFEDIVFSPAKAASVNLGKYTMALIRCGVDGKSAGFSDISGSGTSGSSALVLEDMDLFVSGAVKNIGTLVFDGEDNTAARTLSTMPAVASLSAAGMVQIGNVELDADGRLSGAATVTRKNGSITKLVPQITIAGDVYSESSRSLYLDMMEKTEAGWKQVDLDGTDAEQIGKTGISFAKAVKVSYARIYAWQRNEGEPLIKYSGCLTYYEEGYGVVLSYVENGVEYQIPCYTFADAVTEINNRKKQTDYVITLTNNSAAVSGVRQDILNTVPQALTMPNKKYIRSLVIQADPKAENIQLGFTGNITFTSDTILRDVQLIQMVKSGSKYVKVDVAKDDYPEAVTIKTGGFDLYIDGKVTINAPLILNGGNKGALYLGQDAGFLTSTNDLRLEEDLEENIIYGSIVNFAKLTVEGNDLSLREYRTARNSSKYKASNNKIKNLEMQDARITVTGDNAKGSLAITNLTMDNGEILTGGKLTIVNAVLEGTQKATLQADTVFNITGTLTSKSNNATLLTRLKGSGKAPYLNVSGKVIRETGIKPVYVGVYPEYNASVTIRDRAVTLKDAPKVTAQLLTAKKASAVDFRPIPENYKAGAGEYHQDNTSGYMMMKSGSAIYVYEGEKVRVAVYAGEDSDEDAEDGELFGFFSSIKEATKAVNAKKDRTISYTYILMEANGSIDSPVSVTLPSYAKKVTIKGAPGYTDARKTITFSGNITLGCDVVWEDVILNPVKKKKSTSFTLNANKKNVSFIQTNVPGTIQNADELCIQGEVSVSGSISATTLCLDNAEGQTASVLSAGGAVKATTLKNRGLEANILEYTRTEKNLTNLTINGQIVNEDVQKPVVLRQNSSKKTPVLYKTGIKVTLKETAKLAVMPKASTDSFVLEAAATDKDGTDLPAAYLKVVKANKGIYQLYISDEETVYHGVELAGTKDGVTTVTECLDYKQAVNEINNRADKNTQYVITFLEDGMAKELDTDQTDKAKYSAFTFPQKNKAAGVEIRSAQDLRVKIPFTGNLSGYGKITLKNLVLNPVKGAANEEWVDLKITLMADNSGSALTMDNVVTSAQAGGMQAAKGYLTTIAGVKNKTQMSLVDCEKMYLVSGISNVETLFLEGTKLATVKAATINTLVLGKEASWDSLGKLTISDVSVEEGISNSYVGVKQNTMGEPQFTVKKTVNSGMLLVRLYDSTAKAKDLAGILAGTSKCEIDSYVDVPLALAAKAEAEDFRAYPYRVIDEDGNLAENADGITKDTLAVYKKGDFVVNGTGSTMFAALGNEQMRQIASDAKTELQERVKEKDIYALVNLTDEYEVKEEPRHESATVISIPSAHTVQILDMDVEWTYLNEWEEYVPTVWYYVQFYVGDVLYKGYVEEGFLAYSDEVLLQWKSDWSELFAAAVSLYTQLNSGYEDVEQFPSSYQVHLNSLKEDHPNWTFVPMKVGRDWDDCVDEQMGDYSWIYYNQPAEFRGAQINSTWYYASRAGIEYYMDPRNFLTESNIFQFEQNTYNASYHTQSALQTFLSNTFMSGKVPDDSEGRTYAYVIWNSGKSRGLSPFNLAARVIQEQGVNGTSAMISGTYPGYEGYFNHYNIQASGTTTEAVLKSGLSYAKQKGWNTRVKSLEGGADFIGNGYILQGQDTLYLQKFDIEHGSSSLHQYMQNIMAPYTEGRSMKSMYSSAGSLNSNFVFKIPVFNNMPGVEYKLSTKSMKLEKGATKKLSVLCGGKTVSSSGVTFKSNDTGIATVSDEGVVTAVGVGKTTITATVKESGVQLTCKVEVHAPLKSITLSVEDPLIYLAEGLPDKVPVLNEEGKTEYIDKEECISQTVLTVAYDPEDTTDDKTVTWQVENPDILTVTQDEENVGRAVVTPKSSGTTTITAKVGKLTSSVSVTVRVPMTEAYLKLENTSIELYRGEKTQINVFYAPYTTNDPIDPVWSSEDESVAAVIEGEIHAVGTGTTTLHAAVGPYDGTQTGLTCQITVKEYTVTFMDESDEVLLSVPGEYGSRLKDLVSAETIPWTLEKEGYIFAGWYTQKDGKGYAVTKQTILHEEMTVYPYFIDMAEDFYAKPIGDMDYTGAYLRPSVEVYQGEILLRKNVDYTVTYVNNKAVNDPESDSTPAAVITGKGDYEGKSYTAAFHILPKNISHTDISVGNLLLEYTGKEQQVRPALYDGGRTLQKDIDYVLSYPEDENEDGAYSEAGTYAVEVQGCGNYTGNRTVYVSISKRTLLSKVTIADIPNVTFNNGKNYDTQEEVEECRPTVKLTYNGTTLIENTDYTLEYCNNVQIGNAYVVIKGIGDYIGTVTKYFRITGTNFSKMKVSGVSDKEYTGAGITQPLYRLTDAQGKILREGLDYQLSYRQNVSVGTAYMIFTGINGYTGMMTKTFTIRSYNIAVNDQDYSVENDGITVTEPAFKLVMDENAVVYDKAGAAKAVTAFYKGELLREDVDYKLTYQNNHSADSSSDAQVTVTGIGRFTGSVTKSFSVIEKDLTSVTMNADDIRFRNKKGFCFAQPLLADESGRYLTAGKDYEEELLYTYEEYSVLYDGTERAAGDIVEENDIPTAGTTIRVTAVGMGSYVGSISCTYEIY